LQNTELADFTSFMELPPQKNELVEKFELPEKEESWKKRILPPGQPSFIN